MLLKNTRDLGNGQLETGCLFCGQLIIWEAGDEIFPHFNEEGQPGLRCVACQNVAERAAVSGTEKSPRQSFGNLNPALVSPSSEPKGSYRVMTNKGRPRRLKPSALFYGMVVMWLLVVVIALLLGALILGYRFPPFIRS